MLFLKRPLTPLLAVGMITLMVAGCGETPGKKDVEATQMEAVLAVHDEVMPEMKTLAKLVAELKPLADSTEAGAPYREAMVGLQEAHQAMMDWMTGFGDRFNSSEIKGGAPLSAEKQQLLEEELGKVTAMRNQVMQSIEQARAVLDQSQED